MTWIILGLLAAFALGAIWMFAFVVYAARRLMRDLLG